MENIVCIGGGNGLSNLLEGLVKVKDFDITAIVSVMDSGGSAGKIRRKYHTLAFGDIRRALAALIPTSEVKDLNTSEVREIKNNFNYRYKSGENKGHTVGNLFLLNLTKKYKSEEKAIKEAEKILKIRGKVIPVTFNKVQLVAELKDGCKIVGENKIDIAENKLDIKRIYLAPKTKINPEANTAIKKADIIIIGPGDLYTSVLCNFVVNGLREAVKKSPAQKIWVNNLTNKYTETAEFKLSDYLNEVNKYIGAGVIDFVLYQNKPVGKDSISYKLSVISYQKIKFIGADFAKEKGKEFVHDSKKIIKIIKKLV